MNAADQNPQTILIVDDIPANLNLLRNVLESGGYRILGATSGAAALQIVQKKLPDLILLDVMMPEMNGFETCRQLKSQPVTASIPVIFITAQSETGALLAGFQVGGTDYITKPFNKDEVLVRIQTHLEKSLLQRMLQDRNQELEKLNAELKARQQELETALASIKTLRGLIPICSYCKKIRDDKGFWERVELYVQKHSEASFSHGICPECIRSHFPEFASRKKA